MATAAAMTAMASHGLTINRISPTTMPMRPYLICGVMPGSLRGTAFPSCINYPTRSVVPGQWQRTWPTGWPGPDLMVDDDCHDAIAAGRRRGQQAALQ